MNQSTQQVIDDLKTLLQGTRMGKSTYEDYLVQVKSEPLRKQLNEALRIFSHHETALAQHLHALDASAEEEFKIGSIMSEFFEKMKAEMANDDRKLLDYAVRAIDMALKSCQDFKKRHTHLEKDLLESINELEKDYKFIYQSLIDLKLDED